jgi:hypothetical protein
VISHVIEGCLDDDDDRSTKAATTTLHSLSDKRQQTCGTKSSKLFYLNKRTLQYLLREQGRLTILKFLPHPDLIFDVIKIFFAPPCTLFSCNK